MQQKFIVPSFIILISIISTWFAYHFFEKAIPIVHIKITMDAKQAKEKAKNVAADLCWSFDDYDCNALFKSNDKLQAFVELEGGGKEAFITMIQNNYYQPYLWQIRFFKEKEIQELYIHFSPDGQKNGFEQILSQNLARNNLSKEKAQNYAEQTALSWGYDTKKYFLVEYNIEEAISKRIDHTFTYERSDISLNKGLYRLKIIVAGDKVSTLQPYIKIPDEFHRRYTQMYSTNELISSWAKSIALLLYGLFFGLFALFFLYKRRYLLLHPTLKLMTIIALIASLLFINNKIFIWNQYITTLSKTLFFIKVIATSGFSVLCISGLFGAIFFIAESLDRYTFGNHIQFFKLWSKQVACSYEVLQQTMLGYCLAAINLGYIVCFSLIATSFGWWAPLSSLVEPNILSTTVPALTPIITAFFAGFGEELSFRAIPIASLLLLTRNSKYKRYWLIFAIILQAVIFAAAHAHYPQQPAYYRLVELSLFFWIYGICYYRFGLLACIISHFTYDAILMLIPIWISSFFIQKIIGALFIALPLIIIFIRYLQQGHFSSLLSTAYNSTWQPTLHFSKKNRYQALPGKSIASYAKNPYIPLIALFCLLFFLKSDEFSFDTSAITISKSQAEDKARDAIHNQFGNIGTDWTIIRHFSNGKNNGNTFIWQTYGKDTYHSLQYSYVIPPHYLIEFVKFTGPVELRAEKYSVAISPLDGTIISIEHRLPEDSAGNDISEEKAQAIAYEFIKKRFDLDKDDLKLVSCDSKKHEHRRDWTIIMKDIKSYTLDQGQARIQISIAGDTVVNYNRYIFPPEEWSRKEEEQQAKIGLIQLISGWGIIALLTLAMFLIYSSIDFGSLPLKKIILITFALIGIQYANFINDWENVLFAFSTKIPFYSQLNMILLSKTIVIFTNTLALLILLIGSFVTLRKGLKKELASSAILGIFLGIIFNVIKIVLDTTKHHSLPMLPLYNSNNQLCPSFDLILNHFIYPSLFSGFFIIAIISITQHCLKQYHSEIVSLFIFIIAGIFSLGTRLEINNIPLLLATGICWGIFWHFVSRFILTKNTNVLIFMLVTINSLSLLPTLFYKTFPNIIIHSIFALFIIWSLSIWTCCYLQLQKNE